MKREQLQELGLEKEIIDKVFSLYGQSMTALKTAHESATEELQTQLNAANEAITTASESSQTAEQIQQELETYKSKYEETQATLDSERKLQQIKEALTAEGGQDIEYLMFKLGEIETLDTLPELVTGLKEQLPSHFGKQEAPATPDTFEVIGTKLDKVDANKTYSFEELKNLSAKEINDNWETVSQALTQQ